MVRRSPASVVAAVFAVAGLLMAGSVCAQQGPGRIIELPERLKEMLAITPKQVQEVGRPRLRMPGVAMLREEMGNEMVEVVIEASEGSAANGAPQRQVLNTTALKTKFVCGERAEVMDVPAAEVARRVLVIPLISSYMVGVVGDEHLDEVVALLEPPPDDLYRFDSLGDMFTATLERKQVIELVNHPSVAFIECDTPVQAGAG